MGPVISAVITAIVALLKGVFGFDSPQETTIDHPEPDLELEGKDDEDLLDDLGL